MVAERLVANVEGPNGNAEIYEVAKPEASGGQRYAYSVRFKSQQQELPSLGEAYLVAGELAGVKT